MKVNFTFKDPDVMNETLRDAEHNLAKELMSTLGLSRDGAEVEAQVRMRKINELCEMFFKWGEYITVELDDETMTATLVKVGKLMTEYTPDNWVVIRITKPVKGEPKTFYKVLAGWSGGYLDGNSWRMNSGITKVEEDGDYFIFHGASGSKYRCHKHGYELRMNNAHIWNKLSKEYPENVHLMDEDTDWSEIKWGIE